MYEKERFDTRFPPEAWSDPEALHARTSLGILGWMGRHPLLLFGLGAMLVFALSRRIEETPQTPERDPVSVRGERLRHDIASLTIARARLERAARRHLDLAERTGDPRLREASELMLRVRDRHARDIEEKARTVDALATRR